MTPSDDPGGGKSASTAAAARGARAAVAVGLLLSLGLVSLHLHHHRHAGALWRDEANSVNVASLPTAAEAMAHIHYDSFPPVWIATLRAWMRAGLAPNDEGYRRLGLAIGLATLGVLWWTSFRLGLGAPLVALLLFGMSPSVIVYGDMVRGYGLAALAIIWSTGAVWAFVRRPAWSTYAVAQLATAYAAQAHFGNGIPLLGIGLGAAAVCVLHRRYLRMFAALALGAVAAALLFALNYRVLGYMAGSGQQELHGSITFTWIAGVFAESLSPGAGALAAAWGAAAILAALGLALGLASPRDASERDRALYTTIVVAITLGGTLYAYRSTSIPTHYWHYLSVTAIAAIGCEVGISALAARLRGGAWLRVAAVALVALVASRDVARAVAVRMTTIDLVAGVIERQARDRDLVVVFPWVCGISFARYYRGPAPWMTLPDLPDHRFHLHALIRERMTLGEAGVASELARVAETLRRGDRIWIAGTPVAQDPGTVPPPLGPPTDLGSAGRHLDRWEQQLGALLERRASGGGRVPLPDVGAVNAWENVPLFVAEGWRPDPP